MKSVFRDSKQKLLIVKYLLNSAKNSFHTFLRIRIVLNQHSLSYRSATNE